MWDLPGLGRSGAYALDAVDWLIVLVSTFFINPFDLFGLRQVWLESRGRPYTQLSFTIPGPDKRVRHPLYVGWLVAFWTASATPVSHLVFALLTTAYILVAIRWEERDMAYAYPEYAAYRKRVGTLVPRLPARTAVKPEGVIVTR